MARLGRNVEVACRRMLAAQPLITSMQFLSFYSEVLIIKNPRKYVLQKFVYLCGTTALFLYLHAIRLQLAEKAARNQRAKKTRALNEVKSTLSAATAKCPKFRSLRSSSSFRNTYSPKRSETPAPTCSSPLSSITPAKPKSNLSTC